MQFNLQGESNMRPGHMIRLICLAAFFLLVGGCANLKSLPPGVSFQGETHPVGSLDFLVDLTYVDESGERHVEQEIFDAVFSMIEQARRLVLVDMFLFNDFQGKAREETRALAEELTSRLIAQKQRYPGMDIVVITDPINTVYGGMRSPFFDRLRLAGIQVAQSDLGKLRDSNPVYSALWRLFVRPFGNAMGATTLPNPFGPGRVSLRSYLSLLNFKANHRKVLIADKDDEMVGLVTSANPHDGSSAHHNVAARFTGPAVGDLLHTEMAVLDFSDEQIPDSLREVRQSTAMTKTGLPGVRLQVITESKIKQVVLNALDSTRKGDRIDLVMFYLADRDIVTALKRARQRQVTMRILLDPNKDAFGRQKNGIPNRQVAYELHHEGVPIRWCDTHGEQCHSKMLIVRQSDGAAIATVILGSANLTRRNLDDFNLETNVAVYGTPAAPFFEDAQGYFELLWNNEPGRRFSAGYAEYRDTSLFKRGLYRFMEASGISTF